VFEQPSVSVRIMSVSNANASTLLHKSMLDPRVDRPSEEPIIKSIEAIYIPRATAQPIHHKYSDPVMPDIR
jgi:hypothetical protein